MPAFHALLIGNGQTDDPSFLKTLAAQAQLVAAADGGADRALQAGLTLDVIIGDLDSVSARAKRAVRPENLIFVNNQNNTDLEKALDWLCARGVSSCTLVGFMGGRWDFTLGNFLSVVPYAQKMALAFAGPGWKFYPVYKSRRFACRPGARVSLIPLTACRGVSLKGLKYPLQNARLHLGGTGRTLSNQTTGKTFSVSMQSGFLFVYAED